MLNSARLFRDPASFMEIRKAPYRIEKEHTDHFLYLPPPICTNEYMAGNEQECVDDDQKSTPTEAVFFGGRSGLRRPGRSLGTRCRARTLKRHGEK
jgi:hypothetical protein